MSKEKEKKSTHMLCQPHMERAVDFLEKVNMPFAKVRLTGWKRRNIRCNEWGCRKKASWAMRVVK